MRKILFGLALLLFATASHAAPQSEAERLVELARSRKLWEEPMWNRLMHYRVSAFGKFRSEADGPKFFLAPNGKTDPQAEPEATIRSLFVEMKDPTPGEVKDGVMHPRCRFPARVIWLNQELGLDASKLAPARCEKLAWFLNNTRAKSVSVVFSSYYLNNPSSAFGHSFLRLNKGDTTAAGERFELLDFGVNYAATVNTPNALLYAIEGVSGGFQGIFTALPYYYKVREYNDFEARDLWSYELDLTQDQVDFLVAHLFELGSTHFDYYYLDENCSYHVLGALDVIDPKLDLVGRLPTIVIPADTIKVLLSVPDFVRKVDYRPSVRATFDARIATLSDGLRSRLHDMTAENAFGKAPVDLSVAERAQLLDAAADYLDLKYPHEILDNGSVESKWKQDVLLARSQLGVTSEPLRIETPVSEAPHLAHGTKRVGLEGGYGDEHGAFSTLSYRFALHDLLDPRVGYPANAMIEFFNLRGRLRFEGPSSFVKRAQLDEWTLFRIFSLMPMNEFNRKLSWRLNVGAARFRDGTCDDCLGGLFEIGAGLSQKVPGLPVSWYFLGETELSGAPEFRGAHLRFGFGPALGLRLNLTDTLTALLQANYRFLALMDDPHSYKAELGVRWGFMKSLAANFRGSLYTRDAEASAGLLFYY